MTYLELPGVKVDEVEAELLPLGLVVVLSRLVDETLDVVLLGAVGDDAEGCVDDGEVVEL